MDQAPAFEFSVRYFEKYLGVHFETGLRYLRLGVLKPDAQIAGDSRPLFATDPASVSAHQAAIRAYKMRLRLARENVKDLRYVG